MVKWLKKYDNGGPINGPKVPPIKLNGTEVYEHGEDSATADKLENGVNPTDLTQKGIKYAKQIGKQAAQQGKKAVISSDIQRAKETADLMANEAGMQHTTSPLLRTWDIGEYDGAPEGSFKEKQWVKNPNTVVPGGEPFSNFAQRMEQAYDMVKKAPASDDIITHSKVTRAFKALESTGGQWTDKTTKKFSDLKDEPKKENGGWLNKYEQGGLVLKQQPHDNYGKQSNYNDAKASTGPGFVGLGYGASNWKSPAWGGQFQNGGSLHNKAWVDSVNNANMDKDFVQRYYAKNNPPAPIHLSQTPSGEMSTHYMADADNMVFPTVVNPKTFNPLDVYTQPGKLQYLDKPGPVVDRRTAVDYARRTGEYIDFKNEQDAQWYANNGYKKGTDVLNSIDKGKAYNNPKYQMGGSMPGAVGFTYARTAGSAPANGKYTKKTKASAQNGIIVNDLNDPRLKAYQDSLRLYNNNPNQNDLNQLLKQGIYIKTKGTIPGVKNQPIAMYSPNTEKMDEYNKAGKNYSYISPTDESAKQKGYKKINGEYFDKDGARVVVSQGIYKKPVQPIEYQKPEPAPVVAQQPTPQPKPLYNYDDEDAERIFAPVPSGGGGAFVGIKNKDGTIQYVKPEDYKRMGVPNYGQEYIKAHQKMQNGGEMRFYQQGLDFTPKTISKNGSVIEDDMGQWAHPGEITRINSNNITMEGVDYPVLGVSDTFDTQMMQPNQDYKFDGKKVTEYPMAQNGDWLNKYDNIPSGNNLKKQAEESIAKRNANRPTMSQYTPKKGEVERLEKEKAQRREENSALLNRAASSKYAANAMNNIIEPGFDLYTLGEGALATRALAKPALEAAGKYLTEETALKNAYKLNPYAFKANPEAFYRQVYGDEAYNSFLQHGPKTMEQITSGRSPAGQLIDMTKNWPSESTNIVGANETIASKVMPNTNTLPYFKKGNPYYAPSFGESQAKEYLFETKPGAKDIEDFIPGAGFNIHDVNSPLPSAKALSSYEGRNVLHPMSEFNSPENYNVYQRDWLKGYKEVAKPTSTQQVTRGPINYWEEPRFAKRNPNFNPEAYGNSPVGNPNASRDIPKGMEPRYFEDKKNGGWLNKYK